MQKKNIIFILYFLFSCNSLSDAIGDNNELIIISSEEDREFVSLSLSNVINNYINTPIEETIYNNNWISPIDFNDYMNYKNIMIISLKHPADSTIDLLNKKFYNIYKEDIFVLTDVYAMGQKIISINAHDSNHLNKIISSNLDWINEEIDDNISNNIIKNLEPELNDSIITEIEQKFNFNMHIDINYKIIKNENDFLWIGRGYPYRWIVINKIKVNHNNKYWNLFKSKIENNIEGLHINDLYKKIIKDDNYIIMQGIYDYDVSDTGGPFFSYVFENVSNKEVILISGFVSNPGKVKLPLLKQLETIITKTKVDTYE